MSVRYATPDTFAYVVSVYVCRCGWTTEQHGPHAGELPSGWVHLGADEDGEHLCAVCAGNAQAPTKS
jgi:hypothetical protein